MNAQKKVYEFSIDLWMCLHNTEKKTSRTNRENAIGDFIVALLGYSQNYPFALPYARKEI